jgi:hypothetical protein
MASGNTIFILDPKGSIAPTTLFATPDTIPDTSSPATDTPVLDFDPSTSEHADWHVTVPSHYNGGGFTISWKGGTDIDNTGTFELEIRIINVADATILTGDLGIDGATEVSITDTPPATPINKLNYSTTGTLSHADAGNPAIGDRLIIRATRDTATDTNTGDLQLAEILILET